MFKIGFSGLFTLVLAAFLLNACKDKPVEPNLPAVSDYAEISLVINHVFEGQKLYVDQDSSVINQAGNIINFRTIKYLISNISLTGQDDSVYDFPGVYGYINPLENRLKVNLDSVPKKSFKKMAFTIGLDSAINHGNPNFYPAGHPLNPNLNNMHWSWSGGYIFCTLEGDILNTPDGKKLFTYHIATDENKIAVEIPFDSFTLTSDSEAHINFNLSEAFKNPHTFDMVKEGLYSHSTNDNGTCNRLRDNLKDAFSLSAFKPK